MIRIKSSRKGKEVMGNLLASIEKIVNNEDLLTDILLRVPTKSLVRFMCVSKHWRSLISDPKFCSNHTLRNPSPLVSRIYFCFSHWSCTEQIKFVSPHCSTTSFPKFNSLDSFPSIRMLCACNALMLGQCSRSPLTHIVYNITTRKYRVLPESGGISFPYTFPACLAFDPSKSPHYKVVLVRYYDGTSYEIDIYHSATGSWKRILIKEAPSTGKPSAPIAFWNGAVHWLNEKNSHLKFEVNAERLTSFPLPSNHGIPGKISLKYIGECGGHLYLIITSLHLPMGFKILEMETNRHSWAVKYEVKLRCSISVGPICKYSVLGVVKTSDNEFEVLLAIHGKVVCYNCKSTKMEILPVFPPGKFESACNYAFAYPFIESLAPV